MKKLMITATALTGFAMPAIAQDDEAGISYDQMVMMVPDYVETDFDALDTDNSGFLDSGEIEQARTNGLFPLSDNRGAAD
ncbi:hypothetical protein [Pseudoponticoccus marisrubri]|uniref:EF-hand domain-containing protein n=1 Tax=Pseudoponticoccus marisrubri TaxID=1685382 RepID=A0A0W7WM32_9RHOB|nr:hypothetical protein [Pseudoponticoccus marisrubri]KUF11622.1 hypothetical protein AVJ23_07665 [Pseudoponticoccus marisrubri]